VNKLQEIPRDAWTFRPAPGRWTIHEIVIHLAEAEAHGFVRGRAAIAEPGCRIAAYDQDRWAAELGYLHQDPAEALELFRLLRQLTGGLLRRLPDEGWGRTLEHPERGTMTLDDWLVLYDEHPQIHIRQIERNYESWKAASKLA
jgi:hypothetical protein